MLYHRPRIKICGITDIQQAKSIAQLGIEAIGLNVGTDSQRKIPLSQATKIIQQLPPFISKVALVVNQPADKINEIINELDIDYLQFHGDESIDFCNQFNFPYIRCLRIKSNSDDFFAPMNHWLEHGAKAILLDAWDEKQYGGTGKQISLKNVKTEIPQPFILAGGINPDNAVQKIIDFQPYALDVNSGVEKAPGDKDIDKIRLLINNIEQFIIKTQRS